MSRSKIKTQENNSDLKLVREYYGKSTNLLFFMNLLFVLVISGLAVYVADIMSSAEGENETKIMFLYTVFVVGAIVSFLMIIGCIMGRRGEYEAALKYRRTLSVITFAVGIISFLVSVTTVVQTYAEWDDAYTATIFILQLVAGIFTVAYSILVFILAFNGEKYYDSKKLAQDIPENMTSENNNKKYMFFAGLSYTVLAVSVAALAFYFSNEIDAYSVRDLSDNSTFSDIYDIAAVCCLVTGVLVIVVSAAVLLFKNNKLYIVSRVTYLVSAMTQLAFVIYSLIIMQKDFVKSNSPDITYIIFAIILVAVSYIFAMKSDAIAKKTNQK